jgi:hypothetical protein
MMNRPARSTKTLLPLVITECLMLLPATFALTVAALRSLEPPQHGPACTAWVISKWMTVHLTKAHAATMFLLFPALVIANGTAALLRSWREDELLRRDAIAFWAVVRRNLYFLILSAGALAGVFILMAAVIHMITG